MALFLCNKVFYLCAKVVLFQYLFSSISELISLILRASQKYRGIKKINNLSFTHSKLRIENGLIKIGLYDPLVLLVCTYSVIFWNRWCMLMSKYSDSCTKMQNCTFGLVSIILDLTPIQIHTAKMQWLKAYVSEEILNWHSLSLSADIFIHFYGQ